MLRVRNQIFSCWWMFPEVQMNCHLAIVLAKYIKVQGAIKGITMNIADKLGKIFTLTACLILFAACAPVQTPEPDPVPPPQNLLGSTDELQLVVELSLDLAHQYGADSVLVVLDFDNMLLVADQGVLRPIEPGAAGQVERMQEAGLKVIALSARSPDQHEQTLQELDHNGFSFQATAWPPREGYTEAFVLDGGTRPVIYQNGVFLIDGQDQGLMLKALLEKADNPEPMLIIMADREQDNLNSVMKAFSWSQVKVHAWRYTRDIAAVTAVLPGN